MSALNFWQQPLNQAIGLQNEAAVRRLRVGAAQQSPASHESIAEAQPHEILSPSCTRGLAITDGFWSLAQSPTTAVCSSCYIAYVQTTSLAGWWQQRASQGAICDMPIKAVRTAWASAVHAAGTSNDEATEQCLRVFETQFTSVMRDIETLNRHSSALKNTINMLEKYYPGNTQVAQSVTAEREKLRAVQEQLHGITG